MHVNYENIWHPNAELPSKSLLKKKKWERENKLKYGNRGSSQLQNILIKLIKLKIAVPPQFKKKKKKVIPLIYSVLFENEIIYFLSAYKTLISTLETFLSQTCVQYGNGKNPASLIGY